MRRLYPALGLALLIWGCSCGSAPVASRPHAPASVEALSDAGRVQRSIRLAQRYLLATRNSDRCWDFVTPAAVPVPQSDWQPRWGELTALATDSLLESGTPRTQLQASIKFLVDGEFESTRALGYASQIASYLSAAERHKLLQRNVTALLYQLKTPTQQNLQQPSIWPLGTGFYPVSLHAQPPVADRAASEAAVAGMAALDRAGGVVPSLYWNIVQAGWRRAQQRTADWNTRGWNSDGDLPPSAAMTAAGLATLIACDDRLLNEIGTGCDGYIADEYEAGAVRWLDKNVNHILGEADNYTLYCLARAALAAGRHRFGNQDWFEIGAKRLLRAQSGDGHWSGAEGNIAETAYALLFLSLGSRPVALNKLEFGVAPKAADLPNFWNERPWDAAHFARWLTESDPAHPYSWRRIQLNSPQDDWDAAPIVFIAGSAAFDLTLDQLRTLRDYVTRGGLIVGNANCGKNAFSRSFTDMGTAMFPGRHFHALPADHPIRSYETARNRQHATILGLGDGTREFLVLIPDDDPAAAWQQDSTRTHLSMFLLGRNILRYAENARRSMPRKRHQ